MIVLCNRFKQGFRKWVVTAFCFPIVLCAFGSQSCIPLAREQHQAGNYSGTIKILLGCPDENLNTDYIELLVSAYFLSGDLSNSHFLIQSVTDSAITKTMISLKARISFSRGDFLTAFNSYKRLSDSDTGNTDYIRQLAICSEKMDSTTLAISYYRRALELNPNDLVSGIRLIQIYDKADELIIADSLAAMLLSIDSVPELLRLRGDVLYRMKEYQEAYKCYEPLLATGTSNADLLRKAGVCKFVNGETELAITLLSTSHLIEPDNEITCYYLGMAYYSSGDYKRSELFFNAAIKAGITPNLSNYFHRMADMYETSGDYSKALESFQSALHYREKTDAFRPELYGEIGRVYEVYFKDYKNAIRNYDLFLKNYSDTSGYKYRSIKIRREQLQGLAK